jgi:predicted nucleic acid-binding protein
MEQRDRVLGEIGQLPINPADTEVLILAHEDGFSKPILTDDMALRRELEFRGALVIGSVGLLVRAYNKALMARTDLDHAIDALFDERTLHLSSAFRGYVRKLINDLGKVC